MGAIGERVAVPSVSGILDFPKAVGARGDVWKHQRRLFALQAALSHLEAFEIQGVEIRGFQALDDRSRRSLALESQEKLLQGFPGSFHFDGDASGGVADPALEASLSCQAVYEGAEPHALDGPEDLDAKAMTLWRG
jgi:hypothetical protein